MLRVFEDEFQVLGTEVADADRLEFALVLEVFEDFPRGGQVRVRLDDEGVVDEVKIWGEPEVLDGVLDVLPDFGSGHGLEFDSRD